jgi:hypothetical protein
MSAQEILRVDISCLRIGVRVKPFVHIGKGRKFTWEWHKGRQGHLQITSSRVHFFGSTESRSHVKQTILLQDEGQEKDGDLLDASGGKDSARCSHQKGADVHEGVASGKARKGHMTAANRLAKLKEKKKSGKGKHGVYQPRQGKKQKERSLRGKGKKRR